MKTGKLKLLAIALLGVVGWAFNAQALERNKACDTDPYLKGCECTALFNMSKSSENNSVCIKYTGYKMAGSDVCVDLKGGVPSSECNSCKAAAKNDKVKSFICAQAKADAKASQKCTKGIKLFNNDTAATPNANPPQNQCGGKDDVFVTCP